ncbi:ATP-dependent DNA ligase [Candidatus Peregrinibacteria bacterium]|nr:ATP-dependent DNA ligase [Candidatus Peregrinibacteria bacterium]
MKTASFHKFAKLCKQLEKLSSSISMREKLEDYFKKIPKSSIKYASYFLMGNINPKYKSNDLGIGDKTAVKIVAKAFDKDEKKVKKIFNEKGDMGNVVEKLNKRKRSSLSLKEVHNTLDNIQKTSGKGSQEKKKEKLADLLKNSTSLEAKYIIRTALGVLRLGVGDKTILESFAGAFTKDIKNKNIVENSYAVCTDIGELGESLAKNGLEGAKRFSITLGRPVQAMLAQRVKKASDILEKIEGDKLAAEYKYDGERVQIHKDGKKIQLFSRRLEDITHQYPDLVEYIKKYIKAKKTVIDGEILAYKKGKILSFQKLMHRRRKHDIEKYRKKIPVVVFVFDILYLNGKSMLKKPYPERRKQLAKTIDTNSKKVRLAERKTSKKFDEIKDFFEEAIDEGLEGIIVKSTSKNSIYQPGKRGWLWIKWKKEYAEGMQESFDVVVVGSYHGKGRRKGMFGALLCAVYNNENDKFETFSKVGAGFTDEDFETIGKKLKKIKVKEKPKRLKVNKKMKPDIYYDPKMVIEVIGAEITRSPAHTAAEKKGKGLALRFPRFQNTREDKSARDTTTVKEIKSLKNK